MTDETVESDVSDPQQCDEPGCSSSGDWIGDIYYACDDHKEAFEELIA